jgi:uncharacterized protein (TIGR00255 family)
MIRSMTAFASEELEMANYSVSCEIRSVNHRYCDISLKLPERLRFLETQLRATISSSISRGKVECTITLKKQSLTGQNFYINPETIANLLAACQTIEKLMPTAMSFSALDVLAFPGVQQETELAQDAFSTGIGQLVHNTLASLVATRQREGSQLKRLVEERCAKMLELVQLAKQRLPEVLQTIRQRLLDRVQELVAQPDFDRLEQELVLLAQKMDIAEELDRLSTHVGEVLRTLEQPDPAGRRLDFLMQELHREANTMGSKSNDKEMTRIAIELKVLIEQMREQIQNIE